MSDQPVPHPSTTRRNLFIFLFILAAVAWLAPIPIEWAVPFRIVLTVAAVFAGSAWLIMPGPARHEAPDILAERIGPYFEREGLCFAPRLEIVDGLCWFAVYCQNRYDQPARGTVCFIPMEGGRPRPGEPPEVPPVITDLECEGGEVGVVRFPYPIGRAWQGKPMVYDVVAKVPIPTGKLLRTPQGAPVGEPSSDLANVLQGAALLALGRVRLPQKGASCELRLPENVAEVAPPGATTFTESIWRYQRPTGGFPVS